MHVAYGSGNLTAEQNDLDEKVCVCVCVHSRGRGESGCGFSRSDVFLLCTTVKDVLANIYCQSLPFDQSMQTRSSS